MATKEQKEMWNRNYRESHKEKIKDLNKRYKAEHKIELKEYFKRYYVKNLKRIKEYKKEYFKKNRKKIYEKIKASGSKEKYNAKKFGFTQEEYRIFRNKCSVCGCNIEQIIEVHHIDKNKKNIKLENLIPLCSNHHNLLHRLNIDIGDLLDVKQKQELKELRRVIQNGRDKANAIKRSLR